MLKMIDLIEQLGINWKLFLSQAVNFFILLIVLKLFVYKPVLKIIKERNQRIKAGLAKAEEADARLKEIDEIGEERIRTAEKQSIEIIKGTEKKAKALEYKLQKENEEKQALIQKEQQEQLKKMQEENKKKVLAEAAGLVRKTLIKTVELKPDDIDEALIKKAVKEVEGS